MGAAEVRWMETAGDLLEVVERMENEDLCIVSERGERVSDREKERERLRWRETGPNRSSQTQGRRKGQAL